MKFLGRWWGGRLRLETASLYLRSHPHRERTGVIASRIDAINVLGLIAPLRTSSTEESGRRFRPYVRARRAVQLGRLRGQL